MSTTRRRAHRLAARSGLLPLSEIRRLQASDRFAAYRALLERGEVTVNQIRAAEGLGDLPAEEG